MVTTIRPTVAVHSSLLLLAPITLSKIIALLFGFFSEIAGLHIIIGAYIAGLFVRMSVPNKELFAKVNDRFVAITYGFLGSRFM